MHKCSDNYPSPMVRASSDTPETDAAELIYDGNLSSGYADVDVCRKLERERDAALETLREIAGMDTSQIASPQQCGAVALAADYLVKHQRSYSDALARGAYGNAPDLTTFWVTEGTTNRTVPALDGAHACVSDLSPETILAQRDEWKRRHAEASSSLAVVSLERDGLKDDVRRLFELLETVEISDSEREFHPTRITSCRVQHTIELGELLPRLRALTLGKDKK